MSSKINEQNARFLMSLKGDECVRVDENGKLYKVEGLVSGLFYRFVSSSYMSNIDKAIEQGVEEVFKARKATGLKSCSSNIFKKYQNMYVALEGSQVLSENNKNLFINNFYEKRYETLLGSGNSAFKAEAIVTMEMCHDPRVSESVKRKIAPKLTKSGVNGTYFVKSRKGEVIGVFKPSDEEAEMPNNPRGREGEYNPRNPARHPAFKGHIIGSAWKKEVAASLVDSRGIAGVPETVKMTVPFVEKAGSSRIINKTGSLQKFVEGQSLEQLDFDEISKIPDKQIHKIAALDLIIGNGDRNPGNLLWNGKEVIPIDHGISYSDSLSWQEEGAVSSDMNCMWYHFPQLDKPFNKDIADWALSLDPNDIGNRLKEEVGMPEDSIRESKIRLMIFQKGLKKGLPLKEISEHLMAMKRDPLVEKCCNQAIAICEKRSAEWQNLPKIEKEKKRFEIYYKIVENLIEAELNKGV